MRAGRVPDRSDERAELRTLRRRVATAEGEVCELRIARGGVFLRSDTRASTSLLRRRRSRGRRAR